MNNIPDRLRKELVEDPAYRSCMLNGHHGHACEGRITFEHVIIFAGKQVQKKWAIISLCAKGHEVDNFQDAHTMSKQLNLWAALNRASSSELLEVSKAVDYKRLLHQLNVMYGEWEQIVPLDKILQQPKPASRSIYTPVSIDRIHIDAIKDHCFRAEGVRYNDDQIVSMALKEYSAVLKSIEN